MLLAICSLLGDVRSLLSARASCSTLAKPAADCVRTLASHQCELPARAWRVFRRAGALRLQLQGGEEAAAKALALLRQLPARLERLSIAGGRLPARSAPLADALLASSAALGGLRALHVDVDVDGAGAALAPEALDRLLPRLPRLESLSAAVQLPRGARPRRGRRRCRRG